MSVSTVFKSWEVKNHQYNRLFAVINSQKDTEVAGKLGIAFDEIRRANRNWDRLVTQDAGAGHQKEGEELVPHRCKLIRIDL